MSSRKVGKSLADYDWSIKHVQIAQNLDFDFGRIRAFFDSITDEEEFLNLKFCFLHFNRYCPSSAVSSVPAEFCCVQWSLDKGIEWFGGSPIDPGTEFLTDRMETSKQCEALCLPEPPYTYKRGVAYSVGEDRYDIIIEQIFSRACTFELSERSGQELPFTCNSKAFRYAFVSEENMQVAVGCLAFLMSLSGKDLRLRLLPVEQFVGEVLRNCKIRRYSCDFRNEVQGNIGSCGMKTVKSELSEKQPAASIKMEKQPTRIKVEKQPTCSKGEKGPGNDSESLDVISSPLYGKLILHSISPLDRRLRLGCQWHQRVENCGSIGSCSVTICQKWVYKTLRKAYDILGKDFSAFAEELNKDDLQPQPWIEIDSIGIEARQRLGFFGNISQRRIKILEEGFIFPGLLDEIQRKCPTGLKVPPSQIVWPVDRNPEEDLNYYPGAQLIIRDPDPEGRMRKREQLLRERRRDLDAAAYDDHSDYW